MRRAMTAAELSEAEELLGQLVAPMFEERAPGVAFWGFYLDDRQSDLENDEVLDRFRIGRGVYAVELVWDEDLNLKQRGEGRVVHTLEDLRALRRRARDIADGMEHTKKNILTGTIAPLAAPHVSKQRAGSSSWLAARARATKGDRGDS